MKKPDKRLSAEDMALFRNAVKGTTPLRQEQKVPLRRKKVLSRVTQDTRATGIENDRSGNYVVSDYFPTVMADEWLEFTRPGVQIAALKKLRKGQSPIEARADLHGLTAEQAGQRLHRFIKNAYAQGKRILLVVHGRGHRSFDQQPVLKRHVNGWLRQDPRVLAFSSAQPKDGGSGAVYVLLKSNREVTRGN
jgi:DNA-nicking Smr family endonuclease